MGVRTDEFQYPLVAMLRFDFEDFDGDGVVIDVPPGCTVRGGAVVIETAFNSGTSDVIIVGDDDDDDRYTATAIDAQAAGRTALTLTGHVYSTLSQVKAALTSVGAAATAGEGYIELEVVMEGRANESST